eukprot:CAMPEP_0174738982 /NCGR_PEP_ID=MMETSP1094-20130205/70817_1 /TAXON_ID=156173 /ORGANISM="Chrysochromulina brevifilum, Strain UTEX LB 985" /LENGTH=51 /DNA_ID=CAMNT_0015942489 /DNA_START=75 /DNA_END=230 /DNA_ORIENTATION=+
MSQHGEARCFPVRRQVFLRAHLQGQSFPVDRSTSSWNARDYAALRPLRAAR